MPAKSIRELLPEFLRIYEVHEKDRIWSQHSNTFRQFWSSRVMAADTNPISDAECDVVIRILDTKGKGNTKGSEAVANCMVPQGAWRKILNEAHSNKALGNLLDTIFREQDPQSKALLIDQLYATNKSKNRLTGPTGITLNALLAAFDPVNNLTMVSLGDRRKLLDFLGLALPFKWESATTGHRIVQTNLLVRQVTAELGLRESARTQSCFWYYPPVRAIWKNEHTIKVGDKYESVKEEPPFAFAFLKLTPRLQLEHAEVDLKLDGLKDFAPGEIEQSVEPLRRLREVREKLAEFKKSLAADSNSPRLYPVWYATNRRPNDPNDHTQGYGFDRDDQVHHGYCMVSVPKWHKFGTTGSSGLIHFLLRLTTGRDDRLALQEIHPQSEEEFWKELKGLLEADVESERVALVYFHGYNVDFREAAIRAAQMGFDLSIPGITAFFSWPSKGAQIGYAADAASIEASESAIARFLQQLAHQSGATKVHIIAHSMGNRGLLRAMQRIVTRAQSEAAVRFGQIFLAAPDVDAQLFQELAGIYPNVSERTTLYASSRDKALGLSQFLHDFPRAGYTPPITIVPGIDTVEVSNIDITNLGHGYYADAHPVLCDMHQMLLNNVPPGNRIRLERCSAPNGSCYWTIRA